MVYVMEVTEVRVEYSVSKLDTGAGKVRVLAARLLCVSSRRVWDRPKLAGNCVRLV